MMKFGRELDHTRAQERRYMTMSAGKGRLNRAAFSFRPKVSISNSTPFLDLYVHPCAGTNANLLCIVPIVSPQRFYGAIDQMN